MTPNPDDPLFRVLAAIYNRAGIRSIPVVTAQEALILTLLERLDDEPRCEYAHVESVCGGHVTHRGTDCYHSVLFCETATQKIVFQMSHGHTCNKCGRPASQCWKVNPA